MAILREHTSKTCAHVAHTENVFCLKHWREQGQGMFSVPYRDSVLTKLLKDALCGNSKTIMVSRTSNANFLATRTLLTHTHGAVSVVSTTAARD